MHVLCTHFVSDIVTVLFAFMGCLHVSQILFSNISSRHIFEMGGILFSEQFEYLNLKLNHIKRLELESETQKRLLG